MRMKRRKYLIICYTKLKVSKIALLNKGSNRISEEMIYKNFDKVAMGYDEDDIADPKDMEEYYSPKEQSKYGVLGIKIKKM